MSFTGKKQAFVHKAKRLVKELVPYGLTAYYQRTHERIVEKRRAGKVENVRAYFLSLNRDEQDAEILEIIQYLENNPLTMIPYAFTKNYDSEEIRILVDPSCKMKYVIQDGKRLYFPRQWGFNTVRRAYNALRMEQDKHSPHRYETPEYTVKEGDVIADIGTAEGIWALTYAEKASAIYLFESEPMWVKALEKTFEPWKDKVFIINKYVSNESAGANVRLDDFFGDGKINFIKADIEGAEIQLLEGAEKVLSGQGDVKLLLCTYHRKDDAARAKEFLGRYGFRTEYSRGYMFPVWDGEWDIPYVRRGLIRASKRENPAE
jgi:hypothetical protein